MHPKATHPLAPQLRAGGYQAFPIAQIHVESLVQLHPTESGQRKPPGRFYGRLGHQRVSPVGGVWKSRAELYIESCG